MSSRPITDADRDGDRKLVRLRSRRLCSLPVRNLQLRHLRFKPFLPARPLRKWSTMPQDRRSSAPRRHQVTATWSCTTTTFASISQEILSRQDPRLVDAWEVCERYRVARLHDPRDVRSTFETSFLRDCVNIDRRYNQATIAIRRDLETRIAAAYLATVAQAGVGRP